MRKDWHERALCKVHLDMHCPDWHESILENFDAEAVVSSAVKAGADALYFFAKDCYGNAYYDTAIGHRHKCIGDRDLLAEVLEAAGKMDLPIMAYYSVIWDNRACAEHPDWEMMQPDGGPVKDAVSSDSTKWQYVCHNSGYADFAAAMIAEITSKYPVNGLHMDMFNLDFGGLSCYCANCARLFKEETGRELPRTPEWDETWRLFLAFRYRSVERLAELLREAGLKNNPDLCVVMNYHGSPNFDWRVGQQPVRHSLFSDLGTGETYTPMLGDMYPGMEARFIRNLVPGKPFEMVSWRMNRITDFTVKSLHHLRWEIFTSLVNGGSAMLIDQPFHDGRVDEVAYEQMGKVFGEVKQMAEYLGGEFVKHTALYYSCRNRDLYGREEQAKFGLPVMGAYKALTESHLGVDFLFDETVTGERVKEFPLVFLPNVAVMTDEEVGLFRDYVREGGCLIATYDTSLYSATGEKLENFQLKDMFGVDYAETVDCDTSYTRNVPEPYGRGIHRRYHVLNQGPVHLVKTTTAEGVGDLHDSFFKRIFPNQFFSHNVHPPYKRLSDAIYVNRYGKGTCVYLPYGCDASYADLYELPEHRLLLGNLVRELVGTGEVAIEAPLNVEAAITEKDGRLLVHLIAFNPIRQATTLPTLNTPIRPSIRMEEPALYRATLRVSGPIGAVRAARPGTQVEVDGSEIKLMCDDVYEVITIERG